MDRRPLIDMLYALANGTLASEEAGRLRERCAADPELQALLEDVLEVHAVTEPLESDVPPCRLAFEEVESALASRPARRVVLRRYSRIAAAVLVLVVGGLGLSRVVTALRGGEETGRSTDAIVLAAIPTAAEEVPASAVETPEMLASYRPVEEGEIRWIDSFDTAEAVARLSSRPVFLFIFHPTCPACLKMGRETFPDHSVLARMGNVVPAKLDVTKLDERLGPLLQDGWPWLGSVDANGGVVLRYPGTLTAEQLSDRLDETVRRVGPAVMGWDRIRGIAAALAAALRAEKDGRLAEAFAGFTALAEDETAGPFREDARNGLVRLGQRARGAVVKARELASTEAGVATALTSLDEARALFAGTPFGEDLDRIRDHLAADGRFPSIRGLDEEDGESR